MATTPTPRPNVSAPPTTPPAVATPLPTEVNNGANLAATAADPVPQAEKKSMEERLKERKPFGGFSKKMEVYGELPGYVLYWINDDGPRIPQLLQYGFEFVTRNDGVIVASGGIDQNNDPGDKIRFAVGQNGPVPMYGYLMKLPVEFAQQDQDAKNERNEAIMNAIRGGGGRVAGSDVPQDGTTYNPNVGVGLATQFRQHTAANSRSITGMQRDTAKRMG